MEFFKFFGSCPRMITSPFKSLSQIYFEYQSNILKYGFICSIVSQISWSLAMILMNGSILTLDAADIFGELVFSLLVGYFVTMLGFGLIFIFLSILKKEIKTDDLLGLFFLSDFPLFLTLPVAILVSPLNEQIGFIFSLFQIAAMILSILLKAKSISTVTGFTSGKSLGILILPFVIIIFIGLYALIYFSGLMMKHWSF